MVRKGDQINILWSIDSNSLLHCSFELPDVGLYHSLENMYAPTSSAANFDGEDGALLARSSLGSARADLEQLERALGSRISTQSQDIRKKLDSHTETLSLSHEADTRRMVTQEARFLRQEIYRLRHAPENLSLIQQIEIDDFIGDYSTYFANQVDADTHNNITRQVAFAREALLHGDLADSRQALDEAHAVLRTFIHQQPAFWIAQFDRLLEERYNAADKGRHDDLAQRGQAALNRNDPDELKGIVIEMMKNMVQSTGSGNTSILSGLMV